MASEDTHAHPHGNMVAQPVDPVTAAQSSLREAMSAATIESGKGARMDLSDEFDLSEVSPAKCATTPVSGSYAIVVSVGVRHDPVPVLQAQDPGPVASGPHPVVSPSSVPRPLPRLLPL